MLSRFLNIAAVGVFFLLGSVWVVAQTDQLAADEAAIAANIKALHSEKSEVREDAAKELRRIIAKYPSGTSNIRIKDGGEAYWTDKVNQVVPGMTEAEVVKILPPIEGLSIGNGEGPVTLYRLDDNWFVNIRYRNPDKVIERPELVKRELGIYVEPPKNYTGTWITWYVNGQKEYEIHFVDRKYDGVFTHFYDNGSKMVEQHYSNHEGNGPDTGWYPDGKISYTGQYLNGKMNGQWIHYYQSGLKSSETNFKNGVYDGVDASWYENGQMRFEMNYKDGVQDGIEAAWNEHGLLQYKRERKNGQVLPVPN